jgi:hypothetical protein
MSECAVVGERGLWGDGSLVEGVNLSRCRWADSRDPRASVRGWREGGKEGGKRCGRRSAGTRTGKEQKNRTPKRECVCVCACVRAQSTLRAVRGAGRGLAARALAVPHDKRGGGGLRAAVAALPCSWVSCCGVPFGWLHMVPQSGASGENTGKKQDRKPANNDPGKEATWRTGTKQRKRVEK